MKSIKTMLLGLAFLIIACCGVPFWVAGASVGAVAFIAGFVIGLILCIKGYVSKEE